MRADQQSLRSALEDQGRGLRHHFDHALALAVGGLREYVKRRFASLNDEVAVVTRVASRLDGADQERPARRRAGPAERLVNPQATHGPL